MPLNNKPTWPPKAPDAAYLERAALYYLERFAASSGHLEKVLRRKIQRRCKLRAEEPEPYYKNILPLIERYQASGLLDDARFAQAKVSSMRRKGLSKRMIAVKLAQKGVGRDTAAEQIAADETTELEAAKNLVRRKKLGQNPEKRDKDLAALARAGFPFSIAKQALDGTED